MDVLACIAAGKPVFCEKPLTPTADAALRIMEAEQAAGRRLVTVGFMRRFDRSYREMKALLDSGDLGETLMVHCAHRNPTVPQNYTWDMAINDTAIHEVDTMRWLLGEEFVTARVDTPKRTSLRLAHLQDPLVLVLETESGVRVDDEIFVNCQVRLRHPVRGGRREGHRLPVRPGGRHRPRRFGPWATASPATTTTDSGAPSSPRSRSGSTPWPAARHAGSTSWDGYAAACVCDAGVKALTDEGVVDGRDDREAGVLRLTSAVEAGCGIGRVDEAHVPHGPVGVGRDRAPGADRGGEGLELVGVARPGAEMLDDLLVSGPPSTEHERVALVRDRKHRHDDLSGCAPHEQAEVSLGAVHVAAA